MAKISIIVPVYKVEPYIHRCIDSILAQTYTDFELIFVDDGSPDNCPAICDEYSKLDSRVYVIHKENGGVSSARNTGIQYASGDYITFVDADDFIGPDWLLELYNKIVKTDADYVAASLTMVSENGDIIIPLVHDEFSRIISTPEQLTSHIIHDLLFWNMDWGVCVKLFSENLIKKNNIKFCETCEGYAEDLLFTMCCSLYSKRIEVFDCTGYYYVQSQNSITRGEKRIRLNSMNEVSTFFYHKAANVPNAKSIIRIYPIIHYLFMNNQYSQADFLFGTKEIEKEIGNIKDKDWYYTQTESLFHFKTELENFIGEEKSHEAICKTKYCLGKKDLDILLWRIKLLMQRISGYVRIRLAKRRKNM